MPAMLRLLLLAATFCHFLLPSAAAAQPAEPAGPADLILFNARIWTADPQRPQAQWLAARGGVILALGDGEAWRDLAAEHTRPVGAGRARVLPGPRAAHAPPPP